MKLGVGAAIVSAIIISGCSFDATKYLPDMFTTSAGLSANRYIVKHNKQVFNVIRDGVTFTDGSYITPQGEGSIILPKGYYYVNSDGGRILAADRVGNIIVLKSNGEELAHTKLEAPLVSGVAYYAGIAYLLQGNRFGIYDPFKNKIIYQKEFRGGAVVDNRLANPIVTQNFLAIPTLDGKLVFISLHTYRPPSVLPVGTLKNYGNIIYLKAFGNEIVAATPTNVITISKEGKKVYNAKVADITIKNGLIYILTRDGLVVKLSPNLELIQSKKFAYADFATIAVLDGKIYAFAKSGSLVVMDDNMQKHKVYSVGSAKDYSYVSGKWLYIDKVKVDLPALNYE